MERYIVAIIIESDWNRIVIKWENVRLLLMGIEKQVGCTYKSIPI